MGGVGVKGAGSLVAQQHLGLGGQGAGNGDALLLAAGELGGVGVCLVRQTHQLQKLSGALLGVGLLHARQLHGEAHVAQAGALHQQVKVLEDHGDLPPRLPQLLGGHFLQLLSVHPYLARGRPLQQIHASHQRALTGAAHADDAVYLAFFYREGNILQRFHFSPTGVKRFTYVFKLYHVCFPRFQITSSARPERSACRRRGP